MCNCFLLIAINTGDEPQNLLRCLDSIFGQHINAVDKNKIYTSVSSTLQLLSQAARNMVIQEDAILHSEDVSDIKA